MALLLTAIGICGVMASTVAQRSREIGLRLALGAQHHEVLVMILLQGMKLTAIGVGLGLVCALALGQTLSSMLFDVKSSDLTTLICVINPSGPGRAARVLAPRPPRGQCRSNGGAAV